jgi:hypothetical protein
VDDDDDDGGDDDDDGVIGDVSSMGVAMCWLVSGWRLSMMVTCNDNDSQLTNLLKTTNQT